MGIRNLGPEDAAHFLPVRREALIEEPFSFGSSPETDRGRSLAFVQEVLADSSQAIVGAFADGELIGNVGIYRDKSPKASHKAHIWGMYVRACHRRQGLGRKLMEAALAFARRAPGLRQVHLSVSDRAPGAAALYRDLGFQTWGLEPAALRIDGQDAAEEHMVLLLGADAPVNGGDAAPSQKQSVDDQTQGDR